MKDITRLRIKDTAFYFVHIPKCAGTAFCDRYIGNQTGHVTARQIRSIDPAALTLAIVRHPIDRLVSFYRYMRKNDGYWDRYASAHRPMQDYMRTRAFDEFVLDLEQGFLPVKHDIHLLPQSYFLTVDGKIDSTLMRHESLANDFEKIFDCPLDLPYVNRSLSDMPKISKTSQTTIKQLYELDFKNLGY